MTVFIFLFFHITVLTMTHGHNQYGLGLMVLFTSIIYIKIVMFNKFMNNME